MGSQLRPHLDAAWIERLGLTAHDLFEASPHIPAGAVLRGDTVPMQPQARDRTTELRGSGCEAYAIGSGSVGVGICTAADVAEGSSR